MYKHIQMHYYTVVRYMMPHVRFHSVHEVGHLFLALLQCFLHLAHEILLGHFAHVSVDLLTRLDHFLNVTLLTQQIMLLNIFTVFRYIYM